MLEHSLFQTIPVFQSNSGTCRKQSRRILHCKTMYCCRRTSQSTSSTSEISEISDGAVKLSGGDQVLRTPTLIFSTVKKWIDPRRKKSQRNKAIRVFHCSESGGRWPKHGRNSMQLGQTKDRSIQKNLEALPKHSILVRLKACSEERIAVFSNTITCNRPLQHITCDFYWKNGMREDERGAIPQSKSAYKISSSYAETEIASGGQNQPDQEARESSDHQGASGSCGATNSSSNIRLHNTRHSPLYSPKTRHKSQRNGQTVDSAVRESPRTRPFLQDMKQTEKINAFSGRAKKLITNMGNTEFFELCEISSKTQCPDCSLFWNIGIVYCLLMWKKSHTLEKNQTARQEELWRFLYSPLRHQQGPQAWCETWSFRKATNVPWSIGDVAKSSPTQTRRISIHTWAMAQRLRLPKFLVIHRVDRGARYPGRSLIRATPKDRARNEKN